MIRGCNPLQVKDRALVSERMKAHVAADDATPLLIFPEGTCVNNEYCVMFKVRSGSCLMQHQQQRRLLSPIEHLEATLAAAKLGRSHPPFGIIRRNGMRLR